MDKIKNTFVFEEGYEWDIKSHKASLEHLSKNCPNSEQKNKVWVIVRTDSNVSRKIGSNRFSNDPDGGSGETARTVAIRLAETIPSLILIRVNGKEENGWKESAFWWPIIVAPKNTNTAIFASDTIDSY